MDVPGGVQFHIRDIAEYFLGDGHDVSVIAPAEDDTVLPDYVVPGGRAVPVKYNGSVARLSFGPGPAARVRRWVDGGGFDVVHIHEPITPSLSLLALWSAKSPVVATFHSSQIRSRAMQLAYPMVRSSMERISGRIAVSEDARRTLVDHLGGDAVVIPNGVDVQAFVGRNVRPEWAWHPDAPTFAFLGRIDEPRKGLRVFLDALPAVLTRYPRARAFVAGNGDLDAARRLAAPLGESIEFLGPVSDDEKAELLTSVYAYVAPQTGGESFGIVLVEAMSAGTLVVASTLPAFRRVLDDGRLGLLFETESPEALAQTLLDACAEPNRRLAIINAAAAAVTRYDWATVSNQVMMVYETVLGAGGGAS